MNRLFITGSGTEVGKTLVTCLLVHQLRAAGKPVRRSGESTAMRNQFFATGLDNVAR